MEENIYSLIYKENFVDLHELILDYNICLGYMLIKIEKLRLQLS